MHICKVDDDVGRWRDTLLQTSIFRLYNISFGSTIKLKLSSDLCINFSERTHHAAHSTDWFILDFTRSGHNFMLRRFFWVKEVTTLLQYTFIYVLFYWSHFHRTKLIWLACEFYSAHLVRFMRLWLHCIRKKFQWIDVAICKDGWWRPAHQWRQLTKATLAATKPLSRNKIPAATPPIHAIQHAK